MKSVILASKSPRRKALLEQTGLKFIVYPGNYEEIINGKLSPIKLAEKLSLGKAKDVYKKFKNSIIISADTLTMCRGKIIGKPKDEQDAIKTLKFLNGKIHYVVTAFTIYNPERNKFTTSCIKSKVYFNKVSEDKIVSYIISKKPFDKAGAYGIQELPKMFVKKTVGDYDNIVGLPLKSVMKELRKLDIKILI